MKSITLFCALLILMASARFFFLEGLPGNTGTLANMMRVTIRPPVDFMAFPEDVLPFSAAEWQQHFGCADISQRYIGYTAQSQMSLAVIQEGKNEHLYELGDLLGGEKGGRIISLDEQRIVMRDTQGISVICRGGITSAANPAARQPVDLPAVGMTYTSPMGEVSQVVNTQGAITGYRLQQCQRYCWVLKSLSLQTGDIITAVQGSPVANLTFIQMKDRIMKQQQDIQLTVERAGKQQIITLPWRNIQQLTRFIPETSHHD